MPRNTIPDSDRTALLRQIPSVERLLQSPRIRALLDRAERSVVSRCTAQTLDEVRASIASGKIEKRWLIDDGKALRFKDNVLIARIIQKVNQTIGRSIRRVVNATGVIIHTNLGRSVLPTPAVEAVCAIASGYSNLEFELLEGKRWERTRHIADALAGLTGAEDAFVVNNNAAAVLLCLNTLAVGKEVVVSRGELVEIGGSFRMPDVMEASGAILKEVGTTNKTKILDYQRAIGERTALILKVHTSNYKILGFTQDVSVKELAALAQEHDIPLMVDLGSGLLLSWERLCMPPGHNLEEPLVRDVVSAGASLVTFSADKLLGASQAGVIVGSAELLKRIASNPLTRAVRIDKLSLAALDATLRLYLAWPTRATELVPTLRMLTLPVEEVRQRAEKIASSASAILGEGFKVSLQPGSSKSGGGSLPLLELPTVLVAVSAEDVSAEDIARALRSSKVPVIARVADEKVLLDPRTVLKEDMDALVEGFRSVAEKFASRKKTPTRTDAGQL